MTKPILINNLEFAKKQQNIAGEIALADCPRLLETLHESGKGGRNIQYSIAGFAQKLHLPSLHLTINASLPVQCQRCLEALQLDLNLAYDYVVSATELAESEESDDIDWLEAATHMDLSALIEDELLLALPIAPVHDFNCSKQSMQSGEKPNPFAVLKGKF